MATKLATNLVGALVRIKDGSSTPQDWVPDMVPAAYRGHHAEVVTAYTEDGHPRYTLAVHGLMATHGEKLPLFEAYATWFDLIEMGFRKRRDGGR
jgi:hypothetical protein